MILGIVAGGMRRGSAFPTILDNNATFNDEGDATTGWSASNGTLSQSGSWVRLTKTGGGSALASKDVTFTPTGRDYIVFAKVRAASSATGQAALWLLSGSLEASVWFGSANGGGSATDGAMSLRGKTAEGDNTAPIASHVDYTTAAIDFALHFDSKFNQLNYWARESMGWVYKASVKLSWFKPPQIAIALGSAAPVGHWVEFDFLTVCQPNIISIGDSICAGSTMFNPDKSLARYDSSSTWMQHCNIYPTIRNNLIVNKGVGGQTSTQINARIVDATGEAPRVVFLHASTNDVVGAVSQAARTANIQSSLNAITGPGASAILLNAMYGTLYANDNTPTPVLRDYMLDWWTNYRPTLAGVRLDFDITVPVASGGFMNPALAQTDGLHPTPTGYAAIGNYIEAAQ